MANWKPLSGSNRTQPSRLCKNWLCFIDWRREKWTPLGKSRQASGSDSCSGGTTPCFQMRSLCTPVPSPPLQSDLGLGHNPALTEWPPTLRTRNPLRINRESQSINWVPDTEASRGPPQSLLLFYKDTLHLLPATGSVNLAQSVEKWSTLVLHGFGYNWDGMTFLENQFQHSAF